MKKRLSIIIALVCSFSISFSAKFDENGKNLIQKKQLALGFKIDEIKTNKGFLIKLKSFYGMQDGFIIVGEDQQFSVYSKKSENEFLVVRDDQQVASSLVTQNIANKKQFDRFNNDNVVVDVQQAITPRMVKDLKVVDGETLYLGMFEIKKIYKISLDNSIISTLFMNQQDLFFNINIDPNHHLKRFLSKNHLVFTGTETMLVGLIFAEIFGGFSYIKYIIDKTVDPSIKSFDWKRVGQKFVFGAIGGFVFSELFWALNSYFINKTELGFSKLNDLSLIQQDFPIIFNLNSLLKNKKDLNLSSINLAKIDFVNEKESLINQKDLYEKLSNENLLLDEILVDSDGNSIKDDDGKIARLVVTQY